MYKAKVIAVALAVVLSGNVVRAEDQSALWLTDDQITLIRTNCVDVQSTLQRIHSSDALVRVNLGQRYETIATKLMAPLNSRIALNRLDSVELTKTTADFNEALAEFRTLYQQYEQTTLSAIEMKCKDQPVRFYDTIALARDHRAAVHDAVGKLNSLLKQYGEQFTAFRAQVLADRKES